MIRSLSSRLRPFAGWTLTAALRGGLALAAASPFLACNAGPMKAPEPAPEKQVNRFFEVKQNRDLDILFMIDNSSSMSDEQENLKRNFPRFMAQLRKIEGGLPNVNIAVVTSDMGTALSTACGGGYGDQGKFRTKGRTLLGVDNECGWTAAESWIKSYNGETETNLPPGKSLEEMFTCLALQGTRGCGFEHQLQSTRIALYDKEQSLSGGTTPGPRFLRPDAFLAVLYITDEDDCSAAPDASRFFDVPKNSLGDDSAVEWESFRCSKRGHTCAGAAPGDAESTMSLASCQPSDSGPLIKLDDFIRDMRNLKNDPNKIFVSGIIGWPNGAEAIKNAQYKVAPVKDTANPMNAARWDLEPICTAASSGGAVSSAYPGLRIKRFVEEFGGNIESICQNQFDTALERIGDALAKRIQDSCINVPLVMTKPNVPECVVDEVKGGATLPVSVPSCEASPGADPCWRYTNEGKCPQVIVERKADPLPGTKVSVRCRAAKI